MNEINLNFVNQSSDQNNSQIIIFQKNEAAPLDAPVPWEVIENIKHGESLSFVFPLQLSVSVVDSAGRQSRRMDVNDGQTLDVATATPVITLKPVRQAQRSKEIIVQNSAGSETVDVNIFRGNKLLAKKTAVGPGQQAVFAFNSVLYITTAPLAPKTNQNAPGAIVSNVNAQLSLHGVASADIVMTGGGGPVKSTPFKFSLQNVNSI